MPDRFLSHVSGKWDRVAIALLYLGFLCTGAMDVLLGVMLPRISMLHHLQDSQSGALLFTFFASTSCGALFIRHNFDRTLARGYALTAVAALAILFLPDAFTFVSIAFYGFGLGMAMTSTSMLVGRIFSGQRGAALSFLNFCWSSGATLCPLLLAHSSSHYPIRTIYLGVAVLAIPFSALPLIGTFETRTQNQELVIVEPETAMLTIALFALLAFLYVGVESAVSSWMTTYMSRSAGFSESRSDLATACFWAALLVGRGLASLALLRISEKTIFLLSTLGAFLGVVLLVSASSSMLLLVAAAWTGLALAPIFPVVLSQCMSKAKGSKRIGWVFSMAGFGGACLSWLTGITSSATHSLRLGLLVPAAAALIMLIISFHASVTAPKGSVLPLGS
jgi:fucose permease